MPDRRQLIISEVAYCAFYSDNGDDDDDDAAAATAAGKSHLLCAQKSAPNSRDRLLCFGPVSLAFSQALRHLLRTLPTTHLVAYLGSTKYTKCSVI